jgi:hypothetical protein
MIDLLPHPDTPPPGAGALAPMRGVRVAVERRGEALLELQFVIEADSGALRLPAPVASPQRRDGLWRHTCLEVFVAPVVPAGVERPYVEFNFAPNGDWAAYAFDGYRSGQRELRPATPVAVACETGPKGLRLRAVADASSLFDPQGVAGPPASRPVLAVALSAVVEGADGSLGYWALRHASGRPDFHAPAAFALELGPWSGDNAPRRPAVANTKADPPER